MDFFTRVNLWLRQTLWGAAPAASPSGEANAPVIPRGAGFDRDQAETVPRNISGSGNAQRPVTTVQPLAPEQIPGSAVKLHDRAAGPAPSPPAAIDAATVMERMRALGFTCTGPDPARGIRCVGRIEGYPKPVSFFIPPGFVPGSQVDLVLHLHGWTLGNPTEREVFGRYDFGGYLTASRANAILVVPESDDRAATYNAQWNDDATRSAQRFDLFMDQVVGTLGRAGLVDPGTGTAPVSRVGSLVITGHSGAHRAISHLASITSRYGDKVRAMGLFDATFEPRLAGKLADWAARLEQQGGNFLSAFIAGSGTDAPGREIRRILTEERGGHARLVGPSELGGALPGGVTFLQEKKDPAEADQHWKILARYYATFLRSVELAKVPG
jgi:hypothetical protein